MLQESTGPSKESMWRRDVRSKWRRSPQVKGPDEDQQEQAKETEAWEEDQGHTGWFPGSRGKGEQVRGSVTWGQWGSQCRNLNKGAEWTLGLGNMNVTGEEELSVI